MKYLRGCVVDQINIADDFYEAYKRCLMSNQNNKIVAVPAFANGLFACELYFKYLINDKVKELKKNERHNLSKLYALLDEDIKNEIESVKSNSIYAFEQQLNKIEDGFIIWRYCFEDDNEDFCDKYPFLITDSFLNTYLSEIQKIAHRFYDKQ